MMREVSLSLLVRQAVSLGTDFTRRYPHAWLIWEAGAWNVPGHNGHVALTRLPEDELRDCLPLGDALCYELALGSEGQLQIGRAPENDVILSDATVSRQHATLIRHVDGRWTVTVAAGRSARVGTSSLADGATRVLNSGDTLWLGDVRLTFYDAEGLVRRVVQPAVR